MVILEMFALFFVAVAFLGLALAVLAIIALYKLFEKAGVEGWKAIVPFYNLYVLTVEVAKLDVVWFVFIFLSFIPFIGWILGLVSCLNIAYSTARRFTKEEDLRIAATILFGIFILVFGFGKFEYDSSTYSRNGFFSDSLMDNVKNTFEGATSSSTTSNSTAADKNKFCKNCGNKINAKDKFCQNCGNKVN